jgi:hypothetical protein
MQVAADNVRANTAGFSRRIVNSALIMDGISIAAAIATGM